ncbi:MAG: DUF3343 domain-containing protein [Clostridiales bacterium]|nr:DUF3343 domain-containing protein [Clostridiales bacterium]
MDHTLLIARSITQAQRMERTLELSGIGSNIYRAPAGLTDRGCGYVVSIQSKNLTPALRQLREAGLQPVKIYESNDKSYNEVKL